MFGLGKGSYHIYTLILSEFSFDERSFGFRGENSTHSALKYAVTKAASTKWALEGDISKCFDRINHQRLLDIIRERIKDELVLKLIKVH